MQVAWQMSQMTAALPDSSIFNISNATQECFWHHPEVYSTTGSSKLLLKLTEDELRREAQTATWTELAVFLLLLVLGLLLLRLLLLRRRRPPNSV